MEPSGQNQELGCRVHWEPHPHPEPLRSVSTPKHRGVAVAVLSGGGFLTPGVGCRGDTAL